MLKKFSLFALILLLNLSILAFSAEEFTLGNFFYTISSSIDSVDGSYDLTITAVGLVNPTGESDPPASISAKDVYDALGYTSDSTETTQVGSALLALEDSKIPVSNADSFSDSLGQLSGEESAVDSIKVVISDVALNITTPVDFPDQKPVVVNDRTLVPVRGLFESLGYTVSWIDESQTAVLKGTGSTIKVPINSNIIYKDDTAISVDVPAQLINSRTMLPLRAISEAIGLQVKWDEATKTVTIENS